MTSNYTTVLNVIFLLLALALVCRFLCTNGLKMLRMTNTPQEAAPHYKALVPCSLLVAANAA